MVSRTFQGLLYYYNFYGPSYIVSSDLELLVFDIR